MANEKYLEVAKRMDDRFLEVAGKPYEHVGKGHKQNRVGIKTLSKEFKMTAVTVNEYLTMFHQPSPVLRMIEKGGWWAWWVEALHAPKSIQPLLFQKIVNNEFSNRESVKKFIDEHKNLTKEAEVVTPVAEIPGIGDVLAQTNWSQYLRDQFGKSGSFDPMEAAKARFGDDTPRHVSNMVALVYNLKREYRKKFNKDIVRREGIFYLENMPEHNKPTDTPSIQKTKIAVLVAREVRDGDGARYELDIVGDFNRGMMKEAMKQLMEVLI